MKSIIINQKNPAIGISSSYRLIINNAIEIKIKETQ